MKSFQLILRLAAALVVVGAAIYVIAKYGDKLVAWARGLCPKAVIDVPQEIVVDDSVSAEEAPAAENAPVEEEAPAVQVPEGEPVAEEADFEE